MMLNDDYKDMLLALSHERAEFLLVGAYALAAHGYPRATVDIDFWVRPSIENSEAVMRAINAFGAPPLNLTLSDLQKDDTVFQIGVAPKRIDIITSLSGLEFDDAYKNSIEVELEGIQLRIPSIPDMIRNKRATGRVKDSADANALEELPSSD